MERTITHAINLSSGGSASLIEAGSLEPALRRFSRFYLGSEFCDRALPGADWFEREIRFFLAKGAGVCLLTPQLGEAGYRELRRTFRRLKRMRRLGLIPQGSVEITINDFGAAELARSENPGLPLNAGRLLYDNLFIMNRSELELGNMEALGLFHELGISRFELSATGRKLRGNLGSPEKGTPPTEGLALTMYYPFINLTSTLSCMTGSQGTGGLCRQECKACAFEMSHPAVKEKLVISGNTLFLRLPGKGRAPGANTLPAAVDRLVYCPMP